MDGAVSAAEKLLAYDRAAIKARSALQAIVSGSEERRLMLISPSSPGSV
jgi:hypothetical protein